MCLNEKFYYLVTKCFSTLAKVHFCWVNTIKNKPKLSLGRCISHQKPKLVKPQRVRCVHLTSFA